MFLYAFFTVSSLTVERMNVRRKKKGRKISVCVRKRMKEINRAKEAKKK